MHLVFRQALRGNFRPLRVFLPRMIRGLLSVKCSQCGGKKKRNTRTNCYGCQLRNLREFLADEADG